MSCANVWAKYQDSKDDLLKEELVEKYLPLVRLHAGRLALGLPAQVRQEDLLQAGVLGLLEALQRFDPARGVQFETYASLRIRGAMVDELRRLCWVPRSLVRQMRELDRATQELAAVLGREPEEVEIAQKMGISVVQLRKITGTVNSSSLLSLEETLLSPPAVDGPEVTALGKMIAVEEQTRLAEAISSLPERYQQLLALYYQEELTLKEVGLVLGVSESRVCQLHARILGQLRTALEEI